MYPAHELSVLAARKALLGARMAARRQQCVEATRNLLGPFGAVDATVARWRETPTWMKLIGISLALWLGRIVVVRMGGFSKLARLAPLVWRTAQSVAARR